MMSASPVPPVPTYRKRIEAPPRNVMPTSSSLPRLTPGATFFCRLRRLASRSGKPNSSSTYGCRVAISFAACRWRAVPGTTRRAANLAGAPLSSRFSKRGNAIAHFCAAAAGPRATRSAAIPRLAILAIMVALVAQRKPPPCRVQPQDATRAGQPHRSP